MRWLRWTALVVLLLLILVGGAALWLLNTESGLHFALARAQSSMQGKLAVGSASGTLAGPLHLEDVAWHGPSADVSVDELTLELDAMSLLRARLVVASLEVAGVDVALHPSAPEPPEPATEFSLQPPLDIVLERVAVSDVSVSQNNAEVFRADNIELVGSWADAGVVIETLAVESPQGSIALHGTLAQADGYQGSAQLQFDWTQADMHFVGDLSVHSDGELVRAKLELSQPTIATVNATLAQNDALDWTIEVAVPAFDTEPLLGPGKLHRAALTLAGKGDQNTAKLHGSVTLNKHRILIDSLRAQLDEQTLVLDELTLRAPQSPGVLHAQGRVALDAEPLQANFDTKWSDVVLPADLAGQVLHSSGNLQLQVSGDQYRANGHIAIGPKDQIAQLNLDIVGTPEQVTINALSIQQPQGNLTVVGTVELGTPLAWQLQAQAHNFNPGTLLADLKGSLSFRLASSGTMGENGPQGSLLLENLHGSLRQREIAGNANLRFEPGWVFSGELDLQSGGSSVHYRGREGAGNDAELTFALQSLGDWLPDASGSAHGTVSITGIWPELVINGQLAAADIVVAENRVEAAQLDFSIDNIKPAQGEIKLDASGVQVAQFAFDSLSLRAKGDAADHKLTLEARGEELGIDVALHGSWNKPAWNGQLTTLTLTPQGLPPWRLQATTPLSWNDGAGSLGELCLSGGKPLLCVSGQKQADGSATASYRLQQFPISLLRVIAAPQAPLRIDGELGGEGRLTISNTGVLDGSATLTSATGSIAYIDQPGQPLLSWSQLRVAGDFSGATQHVTINATLNESGQLDGELTISGDEQRLSGHIDVALPDLGFVQLLTSELADVEGSVEGSYQLAGTLAAPQIAGQMKVSGFGAEVPRAGLNLHDGELTVAARNANQFELHGSIVSGDGTLKIDGSGGLDADAPLSVRVQGDEVLVVDIPAAKVVASPDLELVRDARGYLLTGSVVIPRAHIDLSKLPGGGGPSVSPDVVIVDAEKSEQEQGMPARADVTVVLGEDVELVGFGLDGSITGQLAIRERPNEVTIARGELRVAGTYQAYGQDLTIERGSLLYAGTPIDNPRLSIRAVRHIRDANVSVGINVQGTAKRPVLTVYSDPAMDQSEALSYLVTGRPLSALKSGEGDMVASAAQALGSAVGDRLAKSIGARLGIDDIGVSDNAAIGGAAFSVGKYLSPRLYLSYGVGLFTPGQVVTLRYILSQRWNLEVQNATTFNRAGLNYRYEK